MKNPDVTIVNNDAPPIMANVADSPRVRFDSLPEPLRRQYYLQSMVHMYVSAYIYGKVDRERMMELLCVDLVEENARSKELLVKYASWFGSPMIIEIPKHGTK